MKIAEEITELKNLDLDGVSKKMKKEKIGVQGAKIEGECSDYIDIMLKKHELNKKSVKGEVMVLDSYDGTEHYTTSGIRASITSYNSQIFLSPCNCHPQLRASTS